MPKKDDLLTKAKTWRLKFAGIAEVDPQTLSAHPLNFRKHPKSQYERVKAAIETLGCIDRVLVSKRTQLIIDGHLRWTIALEMGVTLPIEYLDLTPAEEHLALATFDALTEQAEKDGVLLERLLRETETTDPTLMAMMGDLYAMSQDLQMGNEGKSLETLEKEHGDDYSPSAMWPTIRLQVPSHVDAAWNALCKERGLETKEEWWRALAGLLGVAEDVESLESLEDAA